MLDDFPDIQFSVSGTTRDPRDGEKNGVDYFFLSEQEFDKKVENDGFLEWETYSNNRYGTLRSEVDKLMEKGYFPLLDLEVKGALNVKKMYADDCVSIFIQPPSVKELKRRLIQRGTETEESLESRLKRAEQDIPYAHHFDYVVINDDLETAYKQVKTIIQSFTADNNS